MLKVEGLTKTLPDGTGLLKDLNFTIERGEFVAILGASGAGKSLTLRCILGLTGSTSGLVEFTDIDGHVHPVSRLHGAKLRESRTHMGVIFQGLNLVKRLRVVENVMLGRLGRINPVRSWLYGFTDKEAYEALDALEKTKMTAHAHRFTGSLSGGEMQRVAIARAIYQQPDIYFADEPISSLDPGNAKSVMELLAPLARERPVLGVFHQPDMVARYCTRAIAIKQGEIVYDGSPQISQATLRDIYGAELYEIQQETQGGEAALKTA